MGERATWRTDRMVFAILISSEINAIQSSVVRWSSSLIFDPDMRAARRALYAGVRHACQSNAIT